MQVRHRTRGLNLLAAVLAGATLSGCVAAPAAPADEPLEPDAAFRPQARLVADSSLHAVPERHGIDVEYRIAAGYYLYRSRLRFEIAPPAVLLGPPELPPGIEHEDPFVGKSVIFRDRVTIHLPFLTSVARSGHYRIRITAQGCAEERLCYAPFVQEIPLTIPSGYRRMDLPSPPAVPPASR